MKNLLESFKRKTELQKMKPDTECLTVEDTVKLYSYSSESLTFVEARWAIAKLATCGILIGAVILFGVIKLNPSIGTVLGYRSAKTLTSDNNFLRQQVTLISCRVNKMEMQTKQLHEYANTLNILLSRSKIELLMTDKIALTHIKEIPYYYTHVALMEQEVERVKSMQQRGGL
jgi:hypothetical protein